MPAEINRTRRAARSPPLILLEAAIVASVILSRPGLSISATLQKKFLYIVPQKIVQRRFETALEAHSKELYLALVLAGDEKHNPHQLTAPP